MESEGDYGDFKGSTDITYFYYCTIYCRKNHGAQRDFTA